MDASLAMCLCQFMVVFDEKALVQTSRAAKNYPQSLTETLVVGVVLLSCILDGFHDQGFIQWGALYDITQHS